MFAPPDAALAHGKLTLSGASDVARASASGIRFGGYSLDGLTIATKRHRPRRSMPRLSHVRPGNLERADHPADAGDGAASQLPAAAMDHERLHHRRHDG